MKAIVERSFGDSNVLQLVVKVCRKPKDRFLLKTFFRC